MHSYAFYFFKNNFIHLFLAVLGLRSCVDIFLVSASGGICLVVVCELLVAVASSAVAHGLPGMWAQPLWHLGLVALRHMESSWTRDRTHVPCIGKADS